MSDNSAIEWTDSTWNPIVGCSIVSPGCTNCYAMRMAARLEAMGQERYAGTTRKVNGNAVWTGKVAMAPDDVLTAPLRWRRPRRIFVNSMGDLFHEAISDEQIDRVFAVMALCPQWASGFRDRMGAGDMVFRKFDTFNQWVEKANTWVNGGICLDRNGAELRNGAAFAGARDEGRFPVTIMHRVGKHRAGRLLDGAEHNAFPQVAA